MKKLLIAVALVLSSLSAKAQTYADTKASFAVEKNGGSTSGSYVDYTTSQTQNTVLGAPCGANGAPVFRALCTDGSDGNIVGQGSTPGTQQTLFPNFNISGTGIAGAFEVPSGGTVRGTALGKMTFLSTDGAFEISKGTPDNTAQLAFGCALTSACVKLSATATQLFVVQGNGSNNVGLVVAGLQLTPNAIVTAASYTALATETYIKMDATSNSQTLTLPAATNGRVYIISKVDASANTVTVTPNGSEKFDGLSTFVLSNQFDNLTIIGASGAVGWKVISSKPLVNQTANGAVEQWGQASELLTLATGATTTDTTANLLPANAIIDAVTTRVTTAITTAATFSVGDATTAARFSASAAGITLNSTRVGLDHWSGAVTTLAAGPSQAAAAKVRITTNANPGAGAIRITVFYHVFTAPAS